MDAWNEPWVDCEPRQREFRDRGPWQLAPACDPLFNFYGCYFGGRYEAHLDSLLQGPYTPATVEQQLDSWAAQITAVVAGAHQQDAVQLHPDRCFEGLENLRALRTAPLRTGEALSQAVAENHSGG